jgi:flagellin
MASNITLSAGVRQNLLSLQNTAQMMSMTQNRLATGKKVNSALDNPTNFFTSASLQSRAGDLNSLLDSMSNGIKTLEAADNGLKAITRTVESMQSTLRQARQDKSFKTESYALDSIAIGTATPKDISFSGGSVTGTVNIALNTAATPTTPGSATSGTVPANYTGGTLSINGANLTIADDTSAAALKTQIDAANIAGITTSVDSGQITITNANGNVDFTGSTGALLTSLGLSNSTNYVAGAPGSIKSVDELVSDINGDNKLKGLIRASNDNGKLRIENLSTTDLTVGGVNISGVIDGDVGTGNIGGNDVRKNLVKQFNELRDQLDKLADDASFNGINLLRGDKLKLTFNETGTSTIEIQAKDTDGNERPINSGSLQISSLVDADFDSDDSIDSLLGDLSQSLNTLRSQASSFGSNLSIVQNRTEFTKSMMNTLQTGADALVLADTNEEAANMLALQTRQQLSSTALSLASQADQAVLRLF